MTAAYGVIETVPQIHTQAVGEIVNISLAVFLSQAILIIAPILALVSEGFVSISLAIFALVGEGLISIVLVILALVGVNLFPISLMVLSVVLYALFYGFVYPNRPTLTGLGISKYLRPGIVEQGSSDSIFPHGKSETIL